MTAHAHTGLNSYVLISGGEYIYDLTTMKTGYDRNAAHVYLWTPEEVPAQVAKLSNKITAVRAR